jgi:hypothetical protein
MRVLQGGMGYLTVRVAADNNATVWFDGVMVCARVCVCVCVCVRTACIVIPLCSGGARPRA